MENKLTQNEINDIDRIMRTTNKIFEQDKMPNTMDKIYKLSQDLCQDVGSQSIQNNIIGCYNDTNADTKVLSNLLNDLNNLIKDYVNRNV